MRARPLPTPPNRDVVTPGTPGTPRRRITPHDERPTIRDRYRPAPIPAPDLRRRYERDRDRVLPTPTPRPTPPATQPVERRAGVNPRYAVPGRPKVNPIASSPGLTRRDTFAGQREQAPWTYGRGSRTFRSYSPWGRTASGGRNYGYWYGRSCSPYYFSWCGVPNWCQWGFYSWPAYYGTYWPRYYDYCGWSNAWRSAYVCSWSPWITRQNLWYWPTTVYAPVISTYGYDAYDDDDDVHVTIHVGDGETTVSGDTDAVRVVSAPARERLAPATTEAPSKATLAERHVTLADGYFREGRYQDAVDSYLRAMSYEPDDASIHFALADALFALGDYHYAAFMIGKAVALDAEMATLSVDKRAFYADPAVLTAQIETLRRYAAEKPYDAAAHLVLGYNLRFSGDDVGAEAAFARVLEIDKRSDAAEAFLRAIRTKAPATTTPPATSSTATTPTK